MTATLVIEIKVPLTSGSVIEQAAMLAKLDAPLKALVQEAPKGAVHGARIVKARTDAGQSRKRGTPRLAAAE